MIRLTHVRRWLAAGALTGVVATVMACTGSGANATPDPTATPEFVEVPVSNPSTETALPVQKAPITDSGQEVTGAAFTADEIAAAYEELLVRIYEEVRPSVAHIFISSLLGGGEGSGFVWDKNGHIVTNYHVVQGAGDITVIFADGSEYRATLVGADADADLAVIKIDAPADRLKPVVLGESAGLRPGQTTIAIGNPFGQDFTMTTGIVSAIGRLISSGLTPNNYSIPQVIQTDAAINPGNSGGPLLDRQGRVIGVNTQIRSDTRQSSGVGFAVPVDLVKKVVPSLIENGQHEYSLLGIAGQALTGSLRQTLGLADDVRGVVVTRAVTGEPAASAGVRSGRSDSDPRGADIIVSVDGQEVMSMEGLIAYLALNTSPGDTVTLGLLRGGDLVTLDVTLGVRPRS